MAGESSGELYFEVSADMASHARAFGPGRFDFTSEGEAGGQLVRCIAGELELF